MEPALGPVLAELPPTRRALLVTLRKRGEARAEELAEELGVTVSAVRQHLQGLAAADLVVHRDERSGPGRPRRSYRLGGAAEALFPKAYGELTLELLDILADEDPDVVRRAFERRRSARVARVLARLEGLDFGARVAEIARVLDEDGYLADFERADDGAYRIREHNCAILAVAQRYGHACTTEISFLREVLPDADVTRVAHILSGSHACVYEVRERAPSPAA
ncbi:helix-turn-helix transcriptional regulator [Conexibacter woesei]|uniref:Putative transcriptional regulator n=1 Tax=Conexibacter woesei (strain DSM 14684 / CCUG 47730 / CIP 108061 / JCM 11494 / NBRC 100937 / ID131577) TaxID=469383 RepID=D3FDM3_CONWI|nr:ArsR family transcriptional regulator [Conexibacter woesei]ADB49597.1 putative transcriptional regulator [Conexibacter woesei DSM 14684]